MTVSRLKAVILILAGLAILILLAFFYFIIYRGYADHFFLKAVNQKLPFVLSWQERVWLTVKKLEIKMGNNYLYAPELRINLKINPEFLGKIGAAGILEFENGYASQGEHHLIKDIAAKIPFEYRWPGPSYPLGVGVGDLRARGWGGSIRLKGRMDFKKKYFTIEGVFDKINMAMLTTDINIKKFGGHGLWDGKINLNYGPGPGLEGGGEFNLLSPGGDIKTEFLRDLVLKMPGGAGREKLLQGLSGVDYFPLSRGEAALSLRGEEIKINLILKGQKGSLYFTVNLPASLVERFFKKFGGK